MIRRTAACLLALSLLGSVACGKYGPPERQSEPPARSAPEGTP
jgi:hypothetical protein